LEEVSALFACVELSIAFAVEALDEYRDPHTLIDAPTFKRK
jgi:hypothetical protein